MRNKNYQKKNLVIYTIISLILLFFVYQLIQISGVLVGLDQHADSFRMSAKEEAYREKTIEGDIVDRNQRGITTATEPGVSAYCEYSEPYGFLVGYNDLIYGSYGLRSTFEQYLFYETYEQEDGHDKGSTIQLTTDNNLQRFCYGLLEQEGSVTVIDNQTGEIRAFTSKAEVPFDVNEVNDESLSEYNEYEGFWLPNGISEASAPGSTFKMLTTAAAFGNGFGDYVYNDKGYYVTMEGQRMNNYNKAPHGVIGITDAFCYSSNAYFASLGVELGGDILTETANSFLIGSEIPLDFGPVLHSSFDLGDGSQFQVSQTAFGQGLTQITPFQIAMISQSISSEGVMMQPYLIQSIYKGDRVLVEGETEVLTETVSKKVANKVKGIMMTNAQRTYGIKTDGVGLKTGTAELGNGLNQAYVTGFTEDYSICISYNDTNLMSSALVKKFIQITEYLEVNCK